MNDLDQLLRDAGARLRDTAPSAEATERALAGLGDVHLDESGPTRRRRLWIIAPALLAAAAITLGVLVLTRPGDEAIRPAETTTVPTPTTLAPAPVPSTVTSTVATPATAPATVPSTSAPTTVPANEVELSPGTRLRTTDEDFDGDGGACLTLVTAADEISGCLDGPTRRGAYGRPLHLRLGDIPTVLFPAGIDGAGQPEVVTASTTPSECSEANEVAGQMIEEASCSDGVSIVRTIPTTPDVSQRWTITGSQRLPDGTGLELLRASETARTRVFRTPAVDGARCLLVASGNNAAREACADEPTGSFLAGDVTAPVVVDHDAAGDTTVVTAIDPTSTMPAAGCPDITAGELTVLIGPHSVMSGLLCGDGDLGVAVVGPALVLGPTSDATILVFGRDAEGLWTVIDSGTALDCTTNPAVCLALNMTSFSAVLPFPSATTIAAFEEALGGGEALPSRDAIDVVGDLPTARTVTQMADGLAVLLRDIADPEQQTIVIGEGTPIVIRQTNLDDSVTATIFVIATGPLPDDPNVIRVTHIRAFDVCGRGRSSADGQTVCL